MRKSLLKRSQLGSPGAREVTRELASMVAGKASEAVRRTVEVAGRGRWSGQNYKPWEKPGFRSEMGHRRVVSSSSKMLVWIGLSRMPGR